MTLVRIIAKYTPLHLLWQTPNRSGIWNDITFTLDPVDTCDYVIVLNRADKSHAVQCPPEHVWSIIQEPPTAHRKAWHRNPSYSFRTFTTDETRMGSRYVQDQPALEWHIHRDYDFLRACSPPDKTRVISCITSNIRVLKGHRLRMEFLNRTHEKLDIEMWGRGIRPIEDKWDGLAPYRYSVAIENFSNALYWTEKISDCFLAWTMPIYYGCTRITDYFPPESLVHIDIHDPHAVEHIQEAIASDRWKKNLDAIAHARDLVLNRYQIFPFVTEYIRQFRTEVPPSPKTRVRIPKRSVVGDVLRDIMWER